MRWRRALAAAAATIASAPTIAPAATGAPALARSLARAASAPVSLRNPRLARVHTWAFAIGDGDLGGNLARRYARYDLVVLDGEAATRGEIAALRRAGKLVLGYLDVGTIESYRSWYPLVKRYRLAYWGDWGEWYAQVSAPGYRSVIAGRVAPRLLAKGFDGLFLDNTDMIEAHPRQTAGMRGLVRRLAAYVHARGRLLFAQNGEDTIGPLLADYDGWNREDVSYTYDFARHRYVRQPRAAVREAQAALARIRAAGLLVLATDYTRAGDRRAAAQSVREACSAGALPFVSDIDLTRIPASPAVCPARPVWDQPAAGGPRHARSAR